MIKIKRIISFMIATVIMCLSVFSVFAQSTKIEDAVDISKLPFILFQYAMDFDNTFCLRNDQTPGSLPLECDIESANELIGVCEEVRNYYGEVCDGRVPTIEEINSFYTRLDTAAEKVVLFRSELKFLIDHCCAEKNNNSYYPFDLWESFQDNLKNAIDVYNSEIEGIEVSYAYWNLKFAYNKLCVVSSVPGDVDNSGDLSIFDVTLVQKSVAQMYVFNSSQLTTLDKSSQEEITIMEATKLQRTIAKLDAFYSYNFEELSIDTNRINLKDNRIFQRYRFYKYVGRV